MCFRVNRYFYLKLNQDTKVPRQCVLVFFICFFSLVVSSQKKNIVVLDKLIAFSGENVRKNIFFGSSQGWTMYDGLQSRDYSKLDFPNLIDHHIQSNFFESKDGKIWFATYQSIVCFDPVNESVFSHQLLFHDTLQVADYYLFHLENDKLFGSIDGHLFTFDICTKDYQFLNIRVPNKRSKFILYYDEIHILNYLHNNFTFHLVLDIESLTLKRQADFSFRTNDISVFSKYEVLLASANGLLKYDVLKSEWTLLHSNQTLPILNTICQIKDKHWIAASDNGYIYSISPSSFESISNLIPENPRIDHFWVLGCQIVASSYGNGIFLFNQEVFHFKNMNFPSKRRVISTSINRGSLLVLSLDRPLLSVDLKQNSFLDLIKITEPLKSTITIDDTLSLVQYLRTNKLPFLLDKNKEINPLILPVSQQKLFLIKYFPGSRTVACSTRDGKIFFGSMQGQQAIWNDSLNCNTNGKGVGNFHISDKLLLFTVNNEYVSVYTKTTEEYTYKQRLDINGEIHVFLEDKSRNLIWLATDGGLFSYHTEKFELRRYDIPEFQKSVRSIQLDKLQRLWLSTSEALYLFYPEKSSVFHYGKTSGIAIEEFAPNSSLVLPDGKLMFAGTNALVTFRAEDIQPVAKAADIKIRKILLNDTDVYPYSRNASLTIPPETAAVSFDIGSVLHGEDRVSRIKYRLSPEDENYITVDAPEAFARYTHLRPGNYALEVLATMSNGLWSDSPFRLDILILPPWYETWWARSIFIAGLIGLMFLVFKIYYSQKIKKQKRLLEIKTLQLEKQEAVQHERNRIASEMHDDLGSGLTTIKFLSDKALKNAEDLREAENIKKISSESNALVRNMSEIIWAMNSRFDTLENLVIYIRRYTYEYLEQHGIDFKLEIPDSFPDIQLSGEKRRNIFLVVKEALHNIVKHSGSDTATVSIHLSDSLLIKIIDQGIGRPDPEHLSAGNGLYNMQARMQTIGGTCEFKNGNGWTVEISIPLTEDHLITK